MIRNWLRAKQALGDAIAQNVLSNITGHRGPLCGNCNSRTADRVGSTLPYGYICPKCEQIWWPLSNRRKAILATRRKNVE